MWGDQQGMVCSGPRRPQGQRTVSARIRSQANQDELVILEKRDLWPQRGTEDLLP